MKRFAGLLSMFILVLILSGCGSTVTTTTSSPAISQLAVCLTKNGATFYGTEWCPHCKEQKKLFGEAFSQVNYVDCDKNKVACDSAKIKGYPTWVFADNSTLVGTQTLDVLAKKTSCNFAPEALIGEQQEAAVTGA